MIKVILHQCVLILDPEYEYIISFGKVVPDICKEQKLVCIYDLTHPNFLNKADMKTSIPSLNYRKSRKNNVSAFMCECIYMNLNSIVQQIYSLSYFIDNSIALFTPGGGTEVIRCFLRLIFQICRRKRLCHKGYILS